MFFVIFAVFMVVAWFIAENARTTNQAKHDGPAVQPTMGERLSPLWKASPFVLVMAIVASCALDPESNKAPAAKSTASSQGMSQIEALGKCQHVLKALSKDPSSAEVPYVDDFGSGNEFYFAWGASSKPVRMKNSYGAMLSAGASCTVNKTTGQITSMTLEGKTVL
jgi:hypothetical protein